MCARVDISVLCVSMVVRERDTERGREREKTREREREREGWEK